MFIIRKYVKVRFENRGSPCYFLSSRGQNITNITKVEQIRLFLFAFWFHGVSRTKTNLEKKYIIQLWLIFWTRSSIKLNYFWSLCKKKKDGLNKHVFRNKKWCSTKSDRWFFFLFLTVRGTFHRKDFRWKNIRGTGLISEKTEALYAKLNKRAEAATSSYSVTGNFYNIFILCLWLRIIRTTDQGV